MRYALIPVLVLIGARSSFAQPSSEPSDEHWKKVFQTERRVQQRPAYTLAFSPNGKLLAACLSGDPEKNLGGLIRVWDAATGQERPLTAGKRPRSAKSTGIKSLMYSPDGRLFALGAKVGRDQPVILWEVSTGKELPALEGTDFSIRKVAFSPDGKFVAIHGARGFSKPAGSRVRVFETSSNKEVIEIAADTYGPQFVTFLPDNRTVLVPGPKGVLWFWDIATKKERGQSPVIDGYWFALALKGEAVLTGTIGKIAMIELKTGKRRYLFEPRYSTFYTASHHVRPVVSADGSVLFDGITAWDLSTGNELGRIEVDLTGLDRNRLLSLAISRDGKKVAIGSDTHVSVWVREKAKRQKR